MRVCDTCHTPYKSSVEFCGLDGARLKDADGSALDGVVIDRWRLVRRLGGGGMAAVYLAQHETLDRTVAIKLLYGELAANREFAERFRREATAASRIRHKNVVEVVDFGTTKEGASFLIMELLSGRTLGQALHDDGPFPPARAAAVLRDVACGLAAAHDKGFVHRDLKPGNIMLVQTDGTGGDGKETAKIVDFGLVGEDGPRVSERLTQSGVTMGTPHYMAPEQVSGQGCTAQSDLYSLGVVLHEMLTGDAPFRGSLGEILVAHASSAPPPLKKAEGLEKIAARLLEKEPRRRPRDAWELLDLLAETGLVPPVTERRPAATEGLLDALDGRTGARALSAAPQTATETALPPSPVSASLPPLSSAAPPPPPPSSLLTTPRSSSHKAAAVAVVVGAAAVAFVVARAVPGDAGADAGVPAVVALPLGAAQHTQEKVANAALDAARALVVVDAGVAAVDSGAVKRDVDRDIDAALAARGLSRADVKRLPRVQQALDALARTRDAGDVRAAGDAVVAEIARAPIDAALLQQHIARLKGLVDKLPKKQRGRLEKEVKDLEKQARGRLSESERGQLLLRAARLEQRL